MRCTYYIVITTDSQVNQKVQKHTQEYVGTWVSPGLANHEISFYNDQTDKHH